MLVPERIVRLGSQVLSLRANFRAFHDVERVTGANYLHSVDKFCKGSIQSLAVLLWCLSATSRSEKMLPINCTEHDLQQGLVVPSEFLDLIPPPPQREFYEVQLQVAELLREAGLTTSDTQPAQKKSEQTIS